jgi:hypothetical protein
MTSYSDAEQIAALKAEQESIGAALDMLAAPGGTVVSVMVGSDAPGTVGVATPDAPQSLVAGVRASLNQRYNEINRELQDLGVTDTPPDQAGGPL